MSEQRHNFDALHPLIPDQRMEAWIPVGRAKEMLRKSHKVPIFRLEIVKEVLAAPDRIIQGWDRPGQDEGFVFVGFPNYDVNNVGSKIIPPDDCFLVFVHSDGEIEDWKWRPFDHTTNTPDDLSGDQIWPT